MTQTVPALETLNINAKAETNIEHPITGTVQPLPQFDEDAQIIVAPALAIADNKRIRVRVANTRDSFYTKATNTNMAELQILKPDDKKSTIDLKI